ncbi:putative UDP-N-acetylmuramoyl-tripeptide--D-alanyl-D-alanine ligase [Holospora elegans E1]|uniref:UDP-N-acetylmuramoyl-tripeptide--D-alanyl-D-alanine ligase n=2 Tax=Holospora TaxID=44747 RepID=A0A023DXY7_9PROT|nr:putative UDP-N-acetylmuramoyl-tripeptide--D-alanyl-D-alanine ligase [Holospora elegans E1]
MMNFFTANKIETSYDGISSLPPYSGVSIDTRTLMPGELFIALDGNNFKGHQFVQEALKKGACAAVQSFEAPFVDSRVFLVKDPLAVLQNIAQQHRKIIKGVCYAVTGSVGKTTTKEGLAHVLKHFGKTYASASSYNNHIGVPLSIANCPAETQYTVFEIGTNHPGEISPLVSYVNPDVSVLTSICEAHIENFENLQSIAQEKFEIFSGKIGILPTHCPFKALLDQKDIHWITYGMNEGDVHVEYLNEVNSILRVKTPWGALTYRPSSFCPHWIEGNLGILAALLSEKIDLQKAAESLSSFFPLKGRGALMHYDTLNITCIDESYNAAPLAMRACIQAFGVRDVPGRKILLLGEMGELGDHGPKLHKDLTNYIENVKAAHIFLVGKLFEESAKILSKKGHSVYWGMEIFSLFNALKSLLISSDTLLVKGKNAAKMNKIFQFLEEWNNSKKNQEI